MEFNEGEQVEVIMEDKGFKGSYYAAIIISKEGTSRYKVEFTTLLHDDESGPLEDVIDVDQLRPVPSLMPVMDFDVCDLADAYEHDGWWVGIVYKKLELDYLIYFPTLGQSLVYPLEKLRIHQEWANGGWTCTKMAKKSFEEKQAKREVEEKIGKTFKKKQAEKSSKGKHAKKKNVSLSEPTVLEFQSGREQEVMIKSNEGPSQYRVEYRTLRKEGKSGPLKEAVGDDQLRLLPPPVLANKGFMEKQPKIEYEEQTAKVFQTKQAKNNSEGKRVQMDFEEGAGKIFKKKQANNSFKGKRAKKKKPSLPEPKVTEFQAGEDVEVMLEEEGFEGSYFAAKILSKEGESQYKVEYKTLLKEDESGPLEDVVRVDQLRPSPPHFPVSCFSLYELVDVYQNDGWWVGIINGKFQSDYFVYFPPTEEEIPYPMEQLRIHQDWSDGQWLSPKSKAAAHHSRAGTKTK